MHRYKTYQPAEREKYGFLVFTLGILRNAAQRRTMQRNAALLFLAMFQVFQQRAGSTMQHYAVL